MPVFYLDEDTDGPPFAQVLVKAGLEVRHCREEGFRATPDTIWIPEIAARGWITVTRDVRTRFNSWEKSAIVRAKARVIHVRSGKGVTHPVLAQNFVNSLPLILTFIEKNEPPFIATLTRPNRKEDIYRGRPGKLNSQRLDDGIV